MIIIVFVILLILVHTLVKSTRFILEQYRLYRDLKAIPGPEIRLPFFGNLNLLLDIAKNAESRDDVSKGRFPSSIN